MPANCCASNVHKDGSASERASACAMRARKAKSPLLEANNASCATLVDTETTKERRSVENASQVCATAGCADGLFAPVSGRFSAAGQTRCEICAPFTVAPNFGVSTCRTCTLNAVANDFRTSCDCNVGSYEGNVSLG